MKHHTQSEKIAQVDEQTLVVGIECTGMAANEALLREMCWAGMLDFLDFLLDFMGRDRVVTMPEAVLTG